MKATFFDLLGIDPGAADRAGQAATLWPDALASLTKGLSSGGDAQVIVGLLQQGLEFSNLRPGVDPGAALGGAGAGQLAFSADLAVVGPLVTSRPFYLRALPDHGLQLVVTDPAHPAQVYFAADGRGHELIIDRLPVRIFLKEGLATALSGQVQVGSFDPVQEDSFAYALGDDSTPAELDCFVRLHLTTEGDLILEPSVPLSLGPVRWMGLPARAVYDIQLLPSPGRREYLEWTHNDVGAFLSKPPATGALGFRSIEVDFSQPPFSDLAKRLQGGAVNLAGLELVLEDVVVPVCVPVPFPIPSHGTFGFRRLITDRTDLGQAFDLSGAPVRIPIYGSGAQGGDGGTSLALQLEKFLFRTGDLNALDPADAPQLALQAALIWRTAAGNQLGGTFTVDDQWTLAGGFVMDLATTPVKLTIADTTVGLVGVRFGVSVTRLCRGLPFSQSFELLFDLFLTSKPTGSADSSFQLRSLTGKDMSVVLRDLGWKLGHFSVDGLQMPDGMQVIIAKVFRLIIEEMGFVEEPNGTPYFSFSGGIALSFGGGDKQQASGDAPDSQGNGFGLRVRRLRFRLRDDDAQPLFKLDGLFLKLKYGTVDVEGFGYITDTTDSGWAIQEFGFGVKVGLDLTAMRFSLAAEFIKGHRRNLGDASQLFDYFLAALTLGFLPAGPYGLYDIRAVVASNMAPNLDATFPDGEGMALLKWHQGHDTALTIPGNRAMSDWVAEDHALALGVGCGFSLNGCGAALHLSLFVFFARSKADTGLLVVGELYLLKDPKPIAFVAIEYDIDKGKFGVMAGVSLSLGDFTSGSLPAWLGDAARLSGTIYFGNQPWSFAIGQLADQRSWLALRIEYDVWLTVKLMLGLCVQVVDGGPKGFGAVFTFSAGSDWGIGSFVLWGSFGFIFGVWKTGSDATGAEIWAAAGFKINLFWVFSFGAEISLKLTYLGKHPWTITLHGEIRIDTPWFLPDVTFTIDKVWQEPLPFDVSTITQSLSGGSAVDPTAQQPTRLLAPGLAGAMGDAAFLYTFNQLVGLDGSRLADTHLRDDLPVVSVDATIAIDLAQPVSNDSLVATSTYDGTTDTGVQQVQDLSVRYALKAIAVRRAPRFGPGAGVWTDFITADQTEFSIGGAAPQTLTFAWDVDTRADGKLSPRRLLVNSAAPYSFATQAAQSDEEAVRNDPDYPCCERTKRLPRMHALRFGDLAPGGRVGASQQFSDEGAWWRWALRPTPVVAPGAPAFPGTRVARFPVPGSLVVGSVDLPDPAVYALAVLAWDAQPGFAYLEAFVGVELVAQRRVSLREAGSATLSCVAPIATGGMTRLTLRVELAAAPGLGSHASVASFAAGPVGAPRLSVYGLAYLSLAEWTERVAGAGRCGNAGLVGPPGSDASGKLAWLPNHDYEIAVTTEVRVSHASVGARSFEHTEALYFRTKGLPGLNACENVGDDLRRHVAASYPPRRATLLYRGEPCVLAFENSLSSVLPIDRAPGANDPPEKAQMFPLELNVDRVGSLSGMKRLTVPSDDWILAHRANPYPPHTTKAEPGSAREVVRRARSSDPLVQRLEAVRAAVPTCGAQDVDHASQVLLHEPIGPDGAPGPWEAGTGYRATVRQKAGPFTERSGFDLYDLGAFLVQTDGGGAAPAWSADGQGNLVAPAAGGGRRYASCGELDWDHLQVHARLDLAGAAAAGIAVGVGDGSPVPQAVLATVERDGAGHALVLRVRDAGGERELGRAAVEVTGPLALAVVAYDDLVRASVGKVVVEGPRGAVRQGRVSLVADGPAAFAGLSVGALDLYAFDFLTSQWGSFAEHLGSWDGRLTALATGALGGTPASTAATVAALAPGLPALMTSAADPQERQRRFDAVVAALGIGLRKDPIAVCLSRLTDPGGTVGVLVESPEPISLTRDVTLTLTRQERVWVAGGGPIIPAPIMTASAARRPPGGPGPVEAEAAAALGWEPLGVPTAAATEAAPLDAGALTFGAGRVIGPTGQAEAAGGDRIARVVARSGSVQVEVYDAPGAGGAIRETLDAAQLAARPGLTALAALGPGAVGVLGRGGAYRPIGRGHWENQEVAVPLLALGNGAETTLLLLSPGGAPLPAGTYHLGFALDRDRWQATSVTDPAQHLHEERVLELSW